MSVRGHPWIVRSIAYLRENLWRMLLDLVVLFSWMLLGTELLGRLGFPSWLVYVALFLGVVIYVELTPQWQRPDADAASGPRNDTESRAPGDATSGAGDDAESDSRSGADSDSPSEAGAGGRADAERSRSDAG